MHTSAATSVGFHPTTRFACLEEIRLIYSQENSTSPVVEIAIKYEKRQLKRNEEGFVRRGIFWKQHNWWSSSSVPQRISLRCGGAPKEQQYSKVSILSPQFHFSPSLLFQLSGTSWHLYHQMIRSWEPRFKTSSMSGRRGPTALAGSEEEDQEYITISFKYKIPYYTV